MMTCDRCGADYEDLPRVISKDSWLQILAAPDGDAVGLIREAGENVCPNCLKKEHEHEIDS
jgi:DNA-directed RNA polymerase subunit H (RpoH/RPB5)